jgi:(2S)-methylsuccinyl-CoA dehydrogenase
MLDVSPNKTVLDTCAKLLKAAERLHEASRQAVTALVVKAGRVDADQLEAHQFAAHGLAWQATYLETLRQTLDWARRLADAGRLGVTEAAVLRLGFAEYAAQLAGGIQMSQTEVVRPSDMGTPPGAIAAFGTEPALAVLTEMAGLVAARTTLAHALADGQFGDLGLDDDVLEAMRSQFGRFTATEIAPRASRWHAEDELIPLDVIGRLADMGVFGLSIPEAQGGVGLGKVAMCIVSEALSEGYLGVGSLGTRSEIAAELIGLGGTAAQKEHWLPLLASGEILPTAVFTEPNIGSDLGSLQTRAVREGDVYRVYGAKTWITHGARSDLMTLLVRTDSSVKGYRGLSMLLAPKPRGTRENSFPAAGVSGTEIPVLGYRGMKEYEISFDGFEVPASGLLGDVEGQGFKQLMATFESARIQTAARALGVAQNALQLGLSYAQTRNQFGKTIMNFPRVHAKLAFMAVETMMARQLSYFAARQKDAGRRCDVVAGMAKLLAARTAFGNADCALQIHGGNGYAMEYPISRVFCDARILSIFEGAAEIQAQVIARGLIEREN